MSFQYACFISYRHSDKEKTVKFVEQLVDAIENALDQRLAHGVYIDRDRLKPGYKFNLTIRDALRESVCMVAILSPEYFTSDYCRREYVLMERVESQRRLVLGKPPANKGLIIPLLVWGAADDVPHEIRNNTHFIPMPFGLTNLRSEIKYDPNLIPIVEKIGDVICEHHSLFFKASECQAAVECCAEIELPDIADIGMWQHADNNPQPLPGRTGKRIN